MYFIICKLQSHCLQCVKITKKKCYGKKLTSNLYINCLLCFCVCLHVHWPVLVCFGDVACRRGRSWCMESRRGKGLNAAVCKTTRVTWAENSRCAPHAASCKRAAGVCLDRTHSTPRPRAAAILPTPTTWRLTRTRSPTHAARTGWTRPTTLHARPPGRTKGQSLIRRTSTWSHLRPISTSAGGASWGSATVRTQKPEEPRQATTTTRRSGAETCTFARAGLPEHTK